MEFEIQLLTELRYGVIKIGCPIEENREKNYNLNA
jgi:hypothetical protein